MDKPQNPACLTSGGQLEAPFLDQTTSATFVWRGASDTTGTFSFFPDTADNAAAAHARKATATKHSIEHKLGLLGLFLRQCNNRDSLLKAMVGSKGLTPSSRRTANLQNAVTVVLPLGRGNKQVQSDANVVAVHGDGAAATVSDAS